MAKCLNLWRYRRPYVLLNNVMLVAPFLGSRYDAILCYWGGNGIDFIILKDVLPDVRFVTRFGGGDYAIGDEQGLEVLALLRDRGEIECLDPETGKKVWSDALPRASSNFYSSPVVAGGNLYAIREDGAVFVAKVEGGYDTYWQKDDSIMGSNSSDFDAHLQSDGWKKMAKF